MTNQKLKLQNLESPIHAVLELPKFGRLGTSYWAFQIKKIVVKMK
jgi:hypothetical protein